MAIDVFTENVISLAEAARIMPKTSRNKKLSYCTLYRWVLGGLKSKDGMIVRLESVKVGGTTCTSREALQRFFERLSGDVTIVTTVCRQAARKTRLGRKRFAGVEKNA